VTTGATIRLEVVVGTAGAEVDTTVDVAAAPFVVTAEGGAGGADVAFFDATCVTAFFAAGADIKVEESTFAVAATTSSLAKGIDAFASTFAEMPPAGTLSFATGVNDCKDVGKPTDVMAADSDSSLVVSSLVCDLCSTFNSEVKFGSGFTAFVVAVPRSEVPGLVALESAAATVGLFESPASVAVPDSEAPASTAAIVPRSETLAPLTAKVPGSEVLPAPIVMIGEETLELILEFAVCSTLFKAVDVAIVMLLLFKLTETVELAVVTSSEVV
jgi:hypothetical protein